MLSEIDTHIETRLKKITFNDKPITVYGYIPEREKEKTVYPCLVYLRHEITIRKSDTRPDEWLKIAQDEQTTIELSSSFGGGTISGPVLYTFKPYSTPIDILYEIVALSTKKSHNDYLLEKMFQAFPPGYTVKIGNHYPLFFYGKPIESDDLGLPLYKTSFLLDVTDVWLERLESEEYHSITSIEPIIEIIQAN